jgi:hypothetical protein
MGIIKEKPLGMEPESAIHYLCNPV